ncbi:MAG: hypothetical protein ACI87N_000890, partial [Flavobacteriales bacterium]
MHENRSTIRKALDVILLIKIYNRTNN